MRGRQIAVAAALLAAATAACADSTGPVTPAPTPVVMDARAFSAEDAAAFTQQDAAAAFSLAGLAAEDFESEDFDSEGDKTMCAGVLTGTFDYVIVPEGVGCFIANSTVRKHVIALEHSAVGIGNSTVGGDVKGKKADAVTIDRVLVGGNVHVRNGGPSIYFEVFVCGLTLPKGKLIVENMFGGVQVGLAGSTGIFCSVPNQIRRGDIELKDNFIPSHRTLLVLNNTVGGDGKIFGNQGPAAKSVQGNTFGKQLDCKRNSAPFVGGSNVARRTEGQCF